ncbi:MULTISPECIES: S26 family signal peptidase [Staphylococcus]|nr:MULTISPECIES: S26 family signal peptidase [Staphylococcus]MCH4491033.1 S26 family signal peptidase [Staphylococcus haemolyticus]
MRDNGEYKGDQLYINSKKAPEPYLYLDYNKKHIQDQYLTTSLKSS